MPIAQIFVDLSTWSTKKDQLQPSTPCAIVLIICQLFPMYTQQYTSILTWFVVEIIHQSKGNDLISV